MDDPELSANGARLYVDTVAVCAARRLRCKPGSFQRMGASREICADGGDGRGFARYSTSCVCEARA